MIDEKYLKKCIPILTVVLVIPIIVSFNISNTIIPPLQQSSQTLENELSILKMDLTNAKNELKQNTSILKSWQHGNKYNLHDPLFEEVTNFINNDASETVIDEIENAKNQGLRCALVEILMGENLKMYQLIAFDTVDKGMAYYEVLTDYTVVPEIGKNYVECVFDETGVNPYFRNFNDTIVDILVIW